MESMQEQVNRFISTSTWQSPTNPIVLSNLPTTVGDWSRPAYPISHRWEHQASFVSTGAMQYYVSAWSALHGCPMLVYFRTCRVTRCLEYVCLTARGWRCDGAECWAAEAFALGSTPQPQRILSVLPSLFSISRAHAQSLSPLPPSPGHLSHHTLHVISVGLTVEARLETSGYSAAIQTFCGFFPWSLKS